MTKTKKLGVQVPVITVTYRKRDDTWLVKVKKEDLHMGPYAWKRRAVDEAVEWAKENKPSQVWIFDREGQEREVRKYGE